MGTTNVRVSGDKSVITFEEENGHELFPLEINFDLWTHLDRIQQEASLKADIEVHRSDFHADDFFNFDEMNNLNFDQLKNRLGQYYFRSIKITSTIAIIAQIPTVSIQLKHDFRSEPSYTSLQSTGNNLEIKCKRDLLNDVKSRIAFYGGSNTQWEYL